MEGKIVASLDRNKHTNVSLHGLNDLETAKGHLTLDILVEAIGRDNSGSKFDLKGLMSSHIYLNGKALSLFTNSWGSADLPSLLLILGCLGVLNLKGLMSGHVSLNGKVLLT